MDLERLHVHVFNIHLKIQKMNCKAKLLWKTLTQSWANMGRNRQFWPESVWHLPLWYSGSWSKGGKRQRQVPIQVGESYRKSYIKVDSKSLHLHNNRELELNPAPNSGTIEKEKDKKIFRKLWPQTGLKLILYLKHQNLSEPGNFTLKYNLRWFPTGSSPHEPCKSHPNTSLKETFILGLEKHQK